MPRNISVEQSRSNAYHEGAQTQRINQSATRIIDPLPHDNSLTGVKGENLGVETEYGFLVKLQMPGKFEGETITANAVVLELLWQCYGLDLLDPRIGQWLEHNKLDVKCAIAVNQFICVDDISEEVEFDVGPNGTIKVQVPPDLDCRLRELSFSYMQMNLQSGFFGRVKERMSGYFLPRVEKNNHALRPVKLPRAKTGGRALTFKNNGRQQWSSFKLKISSPAEPTAQWCALEIMNADNPHPYKYELCTAFLKKHWNNAGQVQRFFQTLGVQGSVEAMLEISLGPLGHPGGARYLGLALSTLNKAGKLSTQDLNNLFVPLAQALADPVVSHQARSNLLLALSLGLGDETPFLRVLAGVLGPQIFEKAMDDSMRLGADYSGDESVYLPDAALLPAVARFGNEYEVFAKALPRGIVKVVAEEFRAAGVAC